MFLYLFLFKRPFSRSWASAINTLCLFARWLTSKIILFVCFPFFFFFFSFFFFPKLFHSFCGSVGCSQRFRPEPRTHRIPNYASPDTVSSRPFEKKKKRSVLRDQLPPEMLSGEHYYLITEPIKFLVP